MARKIEVYGEATFGRAFLEVEGKGCNEQPYLVQLHPSGKKNVLITCDEGTFTIPKKRIKKALKMLKKLK